MNLIEEITKYSNLLNEYKFDTQELPSESKEELLNFIANIKYSLDSSSNYKGSYIIRMLERIENGLGS